MASEILLRRQAEAVAAMLLRPKEAAKALALCERSLWKLTREGKLKAVRIGRAVRYAVADLEDFVNGSKAG